MRLRVIGRLTQGFFLQEMRSFQSLFWMLFFPVFLLILFGLIFGQEGFRKGSLVIGVDSEVRDTPGLDLDGCRRNTRMRRVFSGLITKRV